jgi:pseudaminic acid synthase
MLISTGIADEQEIADAVRICRAAGNHKIALLWCTSSYPAGPEDANLRTLPDLAARFGVVSGFSDHTRGLTAPVAAVALDARIIEKHFILDKSIGGPDAAFSLDRDEFAALVRAVRETEKLLGRIDYSLTEKKRENRRFARSLYVTADIARGETATPENVRSIRPGFGLEPKFLPQILGRKAKADYAAGTPVRREMFE